jgi:hypothetical protein
MWHHITPQLPIADVARAQVYYRDALGCRIAWTWLDDGNVLRIGRGEKTIDEIPEFTSHV